MGADDFSIEAVQTDAFVVYQGHHGDFGASIADIILPGQNYTEKAATFINTEGRAQQTYTAVSGPSGTREDWKIVRALAEVSGIKLPFDDINQLHESMSKMSKNLVNIDELNRTEVSKIQQGLDEFKNIADKPVGSSLGTSIKDFYLTNAITRSSPTMAKCSTVYLVN